MNYLIQIADLTGVYGISFFVILINFIIFNFFVNPKSLLRWEGFFLVSAVSIVFSYGYFKINSKSFVEKQKIQSIGIIQPSIKPDMKWSPKYIGHIKKILEALVTIILHYMN